MKDVKEKAIEPVEEEKVTWEAFLKWSEENFIFPKIDNLKVMALKSYWNPPTKIK